ncbi:MAG: hypothetical protein ACTTKH_05410 [Treponema sp.]
MYEFGDAYEADEDYKKQLKAGDYVCKIKSVDKMTSKTGKPMVVIGLTLDEGFLLKYYLLDDRSSLESSKMSNIRVTRFFDCFKIKRGNFNIKTWVGAKGKVRVGKSKVQEDGSFFFEVKTLLVDDGTEHNHVMQEENPQNPIQEKRPPQKQNAPTDDELMQEAKEAGYDVSEEYIHEQYEEEEIFF